MTISFDRGLLLLVGIAAAAPSTVQNSGMLIQIIRSSLLTILGVTPAELSKFGLFSQYAGAAYCYANYQPTTFNLTCAGDSGSCQDVEGAQAYASHPFMYVQMGI